MKVVIKMVAFPKSVKLLNWSEYIVEERVDCFV